MIWFKKYDMFHSSFDRKIFFFKNSAFGLVWDDACQLSSSYLVEQPFWKVESSAYVAWARELFCSRKGWAFLHEKGGNFQHKNGPVHNNPRACWNHFIRAHLWSKFIWLVGRSGSIFFRDIWDLWSVYNTNSCIEVPQNSKKMLVT